VEFIIMSVAIQ